MRLAPIAAWLSLLLFVGALPASADAVDAAVAAARGGALATQPDAEATATASAARQAANQGVSHAAIGHMASVCARAAEIVGSGPSVDLVFAGFRGSPSHWSALSDPGWTSMGTGAAVGADGKVYVSVVFCQGAGGSTPSPPPPPSVTPSQPADAAPATGGPTRRPASPNAAPTPDIEVDIVGLLTAILNTSLDSLTAADDGLDPIASLLERFVVLPSGVRIV